VLRRYMTQSDFAAIESKKAEISAKD